MKMSQSDRVASAYRFPDRIVLHSLGRSPAGFYIACDPYVTLPRNAPSENIGRAINVALDGYRAEVPQPTDFKELTTSFIRGIEAK